MRFVLLLVTAVIAVVAGVAALKLSSKNNPAAISASAPSAADPNSSVSTVEVLVARESIPVGTVIDDSMIEKQPWPSHLVLDGFITSTSKDASLAGKVTRASFQTREPFMRSKIANPNDPSFLAAALPEGMRAVTVAVDAISGVAGYIFPGDRVDVLLTHNVPQEMKERSGESNNSSQAANKPAFSEVLVPSARVLAVNVRDPLGKEPTTQSGITPTSITIEVDDEEAQKLRLAEKTGTISLSLRSLKDDPRRPAPVPTEAAKLTHADVVADINSIKITRGAGPKSDGFTPAIMSTPQMIMSPEPGIGFEPAPGVVPGQ